MVRTYNPKVRIKSNEKRTYNKPKVEIFKVIEKPKKAKKESKKDK